MAWYNARAVVNSLPTGVCIMSTQKQLKKADFLNAITEAPQSRGDIVDSLSGFDFLSSWFDYLVDHFVAQGKVVVNEDGTIQRKGKASKPAKGPRMAYRADVAEATIEARELAADDELADDESLTKVGAVKKASTKAYNDYKNSVAILKQLREEAKA